MSSNATGWQVIHPTQAWPLEKRREDMRAAMYLAIVTGNPRCAIKSLAWIASFNARIKESTFDKWWAEEVERFEKEQLTKCVNGAAGEGK